MNFRIGNGYDVHRLESGYKLWLGGVEIPSDLGAVGHSDADVLLHAIMDALLGAAALGDIGTHFPDTDQEYKGISSLELLKKTADLLKGENYTIGNIDAIIVLQAPKVAPFIPFMREKITEASGLTSGQISVKATTTEGLGFVGEKLGIAAYATALIYK